MSKRCWWCKSRSNQFPGSIIMHAAIAAMYHEKIKALEKRVTALEAEV